MAELRDVASFSIALAQDMAEMHKGDAMTNLRLQKILYFAQGWSLARFGKKLFEEPIEAWEYGPVVPVCYYWYNGYGKDFLKAEMPPRSSFTADEYELLFDTWAAVSKFSTWQLVDMTHEQGTPWDMIWNHSDARQIPTDQIAEYFTNMPLHGIKEKLSDIPIVKPLYRKDGVPVFASEEA